MGKGWGIQPVLSAQNPSDQLGLVRVAIAEGERTEGMGAMRQIQPSGGGVVLE